MTTDDDEAARFAYLAEGNARQARKRVAADVLIRDEQGRILLVNPTYKPYWDLPGGMAEANESPRAAAERELREELGLTIKVGRLLTLDWQPPHGPWDDQLVFTFDGGIFCPSKVASLRTPDNEIAEFDFFAPNKTASLLRGDNSIRLNLTLRAYRDQLIHYIEQPPPAARTTGATSSNF